MNAGMLRLVQENIQKGLRCMVAAFLAVSMVPAVSQATEEAPFAGEAVYSQVDGYEPYTGWQDSPWQEAGDPQYDAAGGTSRKGFPAWSLCSPLSVGVTDYQGALVTGTEVLVVEDTVAEEGRVDPLVATYENPTYYQNIILDPYDVSDAAGTTSFKFCCVAPGGSNLDAAKILSLDGAGFYVTTSPDPETWAEDDESVVWSVTKNANSDALVCSKVRDNWWQYVSVNVPNSVLEPDETYYFCIKNGTASGWGRLYANIVFQFATGGAPARWSGNLAAAAYGREQGNGGIKIGIQFPDPSQVTTDLTKASYVYYNALTDGATYADDGTVNFQFHADGSGTNWTSIASWQVTEGMAGGNMAVYAEDPTASGAFDVSGLVPVATTANGKMVNSLVNIERDWPGRDGVNVAISGLEPNTPYYLVFNAAWQPNNATNPLGKPMVLAFSVKPDNNWDVSEQQDGSVTASLVENDAEAGTYTLSFQGSGAVRSFASPDELPYASAVHRITKVVVGQDITALGSYSCALPQAISFRGGSALGSICSHAFYGVEQMVQVDLTACALTQVDPEAFLFQSANGQMAQKTTVYVSDDVSAAVVQPSLQGFATSVALAVTNGGNLAVDWVPQAGTLAQLQREGFTFSTWTSDEYLMHPASGWAPLSRYVLYARFVEKAVVDDPEPYQGYQGLDQNVTLFDPSKLPSQVINGDILFTGEDDQGYRNQFQTAFDGYEDIQFAFCMGRGSNANGGDGSYQLSFVLPHISILDQDGNTVASYDGGNGALRMAGIVFDGKMDQVTGYSIYAVRLSVAAQTLPAGAYTLRFARTMGANNGISFLGKDVDFSFQVAYPQRYQLAYIFDAGAREAAVSGVTVTTDKPVDVVIPQDVEGPGGETYAVSAVAPLAFKDQTLVRSVDVPAGVTTIGQGAFSDMPALEQVTVRSQGQSASPVWGNGVFGGSSPCILFGYEQSSCQSQAGLYSQVTFALLDDGVYVNHLRVTDEPVALTPASSFATFTVMEGGRDVTSQFRGALTNNRVAGHKGTSPFAWNKVQGLRNGSTGLVITSLDGNVKAEVTLLCQGFGEDASEDPLLLEGYQGNGSTVFMVDAGEVTTVEYDETLGYYSNTLVEAVPAVGATFSLDIAGPGSAWDPGHSGWNWSGFLANVESNLRIEDTQGVVVATLGSGLTWRTLTDSNTITIGVDRGVLQAGARYFLVADAGFSGHNAQATLMKAVRWSFSVKTVSLDDLIVENIAPQLYQGVPATPQVTVSLPAFDVSLWNNDTRQVEVSQGITELLVEGVDYTVSYENNNAPGIARALVRGQGNLTGAAVKVFPHTYFPLKKGDVNLNGAVNIADAQIAYDLGCGMYVGEPEYYLLYQYADVVGEDATVDASDAFAIQRAIHMGW